MNIDQKTQRQVEKDVLKLERRNLNDILKKISNDIEALKIADEKQSKLIENIQETLEQTEYLARCIYANRGSY